MCFSVFWNLLSKNASNVIALSALGATFLQAYISRQHNKLSVKPHINLNFDNSSCGAEFNLYIQNNGVGPALITNFQVFIDEKKVEIGDTEEAIETIARRLFPEFNCKLVKGVLNEKDMLAVNEKFTVFRFVFISPDYPTFSNIDDAKNRVKVNIKYESIYKEKFSLND
jgi:hypothetical protein